MKKISKSIYLIYNVLGLSITIFGLVGVFSRPLPPTLEKGGRFQFLTNLSLIITIFAILSNLITISSGKLRLINKYLNVIGLVSETIVTLIYWTLKLFFINLIVDLSKIPKSSFIPLEIDISIHLFPVLFLSFDYYFLSHESFQIPLFQVLLLLISLTTGYWLLLKKLVVPPGHYPYPFLQNVQDSHRLVIFIVVGALGVVFYQIYEYFHSLINSQTKIKKEL